MGGGSSADTLVGSSGDDTLDGGGGADSMVGGSGDNQYTVDDSGDTVLGGSDKDVVTSSVNVDLSTAQFDGVDQVQLTGANAVEATADDEGSLLQADSGLSVTTQ